MNMKRMMTVLKILVSAGLIAYLLSIIDIQQALGIIARSNYIYIVLALALYALTFPVIALRWQQLLNVHDIRISFGRLVSLYYIGFFFNNFLPTSIGGDVVRMYKTARLSGRTPECITAVFIERVIGFLVIVLLAIIGLFLSADRLDNPVLTWVALAIFTGLAVVLVLVTRRRGITLLEKLVSRVRWFGIHERAGKLLSAFRLFRDALLVLVQVALLSAVYQLVMILVAYYIGRAVGLGVALADFMVCVPAVSIVSMLPSINGLGVREGGYVYLLVQLGRWDGTAVVKAEAFSFTVLVLAVTVMISLIGGVLLLVSGDSGGKDTIKEMIREPGTG